VDYVTALGFLKHRFETIKSGIKCMFAVTPGRFWGYAAFRSRAALLRHLAEQNRALLGTLRPFRHPGIRPRHTSHSFLAFGSMPALASVARFSSRSQ